MRNPRTCCSVSASLGAGIGTVDPVWGTLSVDRIEISGEAVVAAATIEGPAIGAGRDFSGVASMVFHALYTANSGARTVSFSNGAGPGVWVAVGSADGGSRWAFT
jgi:hypothetical protein